MGAKGIRWDGYSVFPPCRKKVGHMTLSGKNFAGVGIFGGSSKQGRQRLTSEVRYVYIIKVIRTRKLSTGHSAASVPGFARTEHQWSC